METPGMPDERVPVKPPRPKDPPPAIVIVLGEKVADDVGDDLDFVVDRDLNLLGPLRDFLTRNSRSGDKARWSPGSSPR